MKVRHFNSQMPPFSHGIGILQYIQYPILPTLGTLLHLSEVFPVYAPHDFAKAAEMDSISCLQGHSHLPLIRAMRNRWWTLLCVSRIVMSPGIH
jgi:hypothetical protein